MTKAHTPISVRCDYCGRPAELVTSSTIYGPGQPDWGWFWRCVGCDAYVGCHKNSTRRVPLGRLANAELRDAKRRANAAFDPLWKAIAARDGINIHRARRRGYAWLAEQMGMKKHDCHIGKFDVAQCRRVVELCAPYQQAAHVARQKESA